MCQIMTLPQRNRNIVPPKQTGAWRAYDDILSSMADISLFEYLKSVFPNVRPEMIFKNYPPQSLLKIPPPPAGFVDDEKLDLESAGAHQCRILRRLLIEGRPMMAFDTIFRFPCTLR
eukprot:TRINITY_DN12921_c0_g1_i1.p1 TRINITY_DN12921_c0_g1~~TRINITY_DN12921_c0_g1_i1.p1  ORF type:complete len:126 (-),score=37.46 TRINITY_DN12921_c0_g1_i1:13-363(-)